VEQRVAVNIPAFWKYFEAEAFPRLAHRQQTLRYVLEHLDRKNGPVFIVETGCVRQAGNWAGDGQSTILFDLFVNHCPGSVMHSVDIDPQATALCRTLVSGKTQVHTGDSVPFLRQLSRRPPEGFAAADLLYLDSYDVDFDAPHASALHHMKELVASSPLIGPGTLVVVDDAPRESVFIQSGNEIGLLREPKVSGKGKYVADYARSLGLTPVFSGYQAGWLGL